MTIITKNKRTFQGRLYFETVLTLPEAKITVAGRTRKEAINGAWDMRKYLDFL